ncbi:MAG: hypothetical protein ACE5HO_13875 [bacterium]
MTDSKEPAGEDADSLKRRSQRAAEGEKTVSCDLDNDAAFYSDLYFSIAYGLGIIPVGGFMKREIIACVLALLLSNGRQIYGQTSTLIDAEVMNALIAESSGERGLNHFSYIGANFSGFAPSLGAEQTAEYIAEHAQQWGLSDVKIEEFPYIGTQEDTRERADATQMKRAIVIAGAAAYIMASAGPAQIPALTQNALEKARIRLAREERRVADLLEQTSKESAAEDYREAINLIRQAYRREAAAFQSLEVFAGQGEAGRYLQKAVSALARGEASAQQRAKEQAAPLSKMRGWGALKPAPPRREDVALMVPQRNAKIRGPVNIFRHQYGQDWLKEKLEDPDFLQKLQLARRGLYYWYEALNFADGERNLGEIRDRVAAEFGPVPLVEIEQYFWLLEKAGVVELHGARSGRR